MGTAHGAEELGLWSHGLACPGRRLGPLYRVLPMIWPYLEKYYELNLEKYPAMPITLSYDGILTNRLLRLKRGRWTCGSRYRASESGDARPRYWHILSLTGSIFTTTPLECMQHGIQVQRSERPRIASHRKI